VNDSEDHSRSSELPLLDRPYHFLLVVTACMVVQAVVKANSQSNGKGKILTPWGSKTPERILMKLGLYNHVVGMQIHVALRQPGWSGQTRAKTCVVVS